MSNRYREGGRGGRRGGGRRTVPSKRIGEVARRNRRIRKRKWGFRPCNG